eukprot:9635449-Alexandrium_andersonii.AAC.1
MSSSCWEILLPTRWKRSSTCWPKCCKAPPIAVDSQSPCVAENGVGVSGERLLCTFLLVGLVLPTPRCWSKPSANWATRA